MAGGKIGTSQGLAKEYDMKLDESRYIPCVDASNSPHALQEEAVISEGLADSEILAVASQCAAKRASATLILLFILLKAK